MTEKDAFVTMLTRAGIPFKEKPIEPDNQRMVGTQGTDVSITARAPESAQNPWRVTTTKNPHKERVISNHSQATEQSVPTISPHTVRQIAVEAMVSTPNGAEGASKPSDTRELPSARFGCDRSPRTAGGEMTLDDALAVAVSRAVAPLAAELSAVRAELAEMRREQRTERSGPVLSGGPLFSQGAWLALGRSLVDRKSVMTAIRYVRGSLPGLPGEHDIAVLDGDTHISRWVEESRRLDHDQNSLPVIGKLIGPESVVYDVGAFIGDHSCFYASLGATVVAIEANPVACECLRRNLWPYGTRHTILNLAAGDIRDDKVIQFTDANAGAHYCVRQIISRVTDAPVSTITLDTFSENSPPTLIKLDIEGWEVRALLGAERTLRWYHPIIVCEVNRGALERAGTSPEELHALLTSHGYQMRDLFTEEPWMPEDPRPQFDVVAR